MKNLVCNTLLCTSKKNSMASSVLTFGTYEGGIIAIRVTQDINNSVELETIISTPSHIGCVRAIGSSGRYSVSGGTDELINVFDIAKCRQLGNMGGSVHTSTITSLAVSDEHGLILSGCEDGQIAITRMKDFKTLRSFKGHKSSVLGLSIHPSGKVAVSASTDNTLRMWDLTRGTCAAVRSICPIRRPNTIRGRVSTGNMDVRYTPLGSRYAILLPSGKIDICSSSSLDVVEYESPQFPITSICPIDEDFLLLGDSKGTLSVLDLETTSICATLSGLHSRKIRFIARLEANRCAASVCADGKIAFLIFDNNTLSEIKSLDTGVRITCFTSNC